MTRVELALRTTSLTLALATTLWPAPSRADVTVTLNTPQASEFARQTGVDLSTIESQLKTEVERLFQTYRLSDYLKSYGDAHAFTTRGLGVDYASDLRFFEIGVAANVAVNADESFTPDDLKTKPALEGVSTNFTVMGGLNFGIVGARPFTLFANVFKGEADFGEYSADLQNWGVHGQLKLLAPESESTWNALLRWGGIAITTGFEHAKTRLSLAKALRRDLALPNVPRNVGVVDVNSMGVLTVDTATSSIPLEVTTSLRLLYIVTIYGGVGFDWQVGGESDMNINVDGQLTGRVTVNNTTMTQPLGTARVVANEAAEPSAGRLRGLLGVQFNLSLVRLFVQTNFVPDPASASIAFGARLAY